MRELYDRSQADRILLDMAKHSRTGEISALGDTRDLYASVKSRSDP